MAEVDAVLMMPQDSIEIAVLLKKPQENLDSTEVEVDEVESNTGAITPENLV